MKFRIDKVPYFKWFWAKRYWGGKILNIHVMWWEFVFDFREDWIEDMKDPTRLDKKLSGGPESK